MQVLFLSAAALGTPVLHCPHGDKSPLQWAAGLHQMFWSLQLLLLVLGLLPDSRAHSVWQCLQGSQILVLADNLSLCQGKKQ